MQFAQNFQIGQRFAGRFGTGVVPLQPARRIHNRTGFFGKTRRGQAEHFGLDVGRVHIVRIAVVLPESGGFGVERIHHHHKFQLGKSLGYAVGIRERALRIKALHQQAVYLALMHQLGHLQHVIHLVPFGQPIVAPIVFFGGVFAIHPFQEADKKGGRVAPIIELPRLQGFGGLLFQIIGKSGVAEFVGQHQISRQHGGEQAQIRQALNIGVAAQSVHAAAGHADIAEQKLHHCHGADHLRAGGVLGPAQGIKNSAGFVGHGGFAPGFGDGEEIFFAGAAQRAHHIQRVTRIMLLEQLPNAARVLQGGVGFGVAVSIQLVKPAVAVVLFFAVVVAAEHALVKIKTFGHDKAGVGVGFDIFPLDFVVFNQPIDQRAQKGDVAARTQRGIKIGHGGGAVETRVDHI